MEDCRRECTGLGEVALTAGEEKKAAGSVRVETTTTLEPLDRKIIPRKNIYSALDHKEKCTHPGNLI